MMPLYSIDAFPFRRIVKQNGCKDSQDVGVLDLKKKPLTVYPLSAGLIDEKVIPKIFEKITEEKVNELASKMRAIIENQNSNQSKSFRFDSYSGEHPHPPIVNPFLPGVVDEVQKQDYLLDAVKKYYK